MNRARALGCNDVIPSSWRTSSTTHPEVPHQDLDAQFEQLSQQYGISTAKLKAVYFRGVREFAETGADAGSPTMYGLARVQRFVNGTADTDLTELVETESVDAGVNLCIDAGSVLSDVLYSSGERVAELFKPGEVTAIQLQDENLVIAGMLDSIAWTYTLDTATGQSGMSLT